METDLGCDDSSDNREMLVVPKQPPVFLLYNLMQELTLISSIFVTLFITLSLRERIISPIILSIVSPLKVTGTIS